MIIIFPPPPLVGPLKSYQVDHLVTATFGTLCQHTNTQSPLTPSSSSSSSSPLSFLFKIFSLPLKEKNPFIPIPPPAPGPHGWYFYLPTISNRVSGPQIKWSVLNAHLKWVTTRPADPTYIENWQSVSHKWSNRESPPCPPFRLPPLTDEHPTNQVSPLHSFGKLHANSLLGAEGAMNFRFFWT